MNISLTYAKHLISRHVSDGVSPLPEEGDLGDGQRGMIFIGDALLTEGEVPCHRHFITIGG
jgi:hypothetical protein